MTSDSTRTALLGSVASGVVAYALGYVFTYALSISVVQESAIARLADAFGDGGAAWKMVGWVFYSAHGATTTLNVDVPIFGGTSTVNFIAQSDALSPLLYVIPPALLVVAGLAAARMAGSTDLGEALRIGPAVVVGYLPLVLVGAILFTVSAGNSVAKPTLVTTIGLAGIVYPAVFGAVGAAIGTTLAAREADADAAT